MPLEIRMLLITALMALATVQSNSVASTPVTLNEIRLAACRPFQQDFDRVLTSHSKDRAASGTMERLAAIDNVAAAILRDLQLHHDSFINQSLANVGENDGVEQDQPQRLGARKIVEKYQSSFRNSSVPKDWSEADRGVVTSYLQTAGEAVQRVIESRGKGCLSVMGVDASEIIRLSFALPMLMSDQDQSLASSPVFLPTWMCHPSDLRMLQSFAVEADYPRVGFMLVRIGFSTVAPASVTAAYLTFVKQESDAMLRTANYSAALFCLRDGIAVASPTALDNDVVELSLRIADILETTDSAKAAADEMKHLQATCIQPSDYGRASTLRLKYLYEGGLYSNAIAEASADLNEPRCDGYLSPIMYIAWLAARRQQGADAEYWRKAFLGRFPDDPLAADMYFAAAMDALTTSNRGEAARLLQYIEYRFPRFKLIEKVRHIDQRLAQADQSQETIGPKTATPAAAGQ